MVKITWSEPAIDGLVAIGEFSGKYSEKYASTLIRKLFSKVEIDARNRTNRSGKK